MTELNKKNNLGHFRFLTSNDNYSDSGGETKQLNSNSIQQRINFFPIHYYDRVLDSLKI